MKRTVKHIQHTQKPVHVRQPDRTARNTTRPFQTKRMLPTKKESEEFKRLLKDDPDFQAEPMEDLTFLLHEPEPESIDEPASSHPFNAITPDLIEGVESCEQLPAEFSMLLPETGEVAAKLSEGQNGEMNVSLGFQSSVLERMVGFERQGEQVLSKRLGKRVRLHFKRTEAL